MKLEFIKPPAMSDATWNDVSDLLRYRALTISLFDELSNARAHGRLKRLSRSISQKWISSVRLGATETFFALGTKANNYFGLRHTRGFPFGNQGIPPGGYKVNNSAVQLPTI